MHIVHREIENNSPQLEPFLNGAESLCNSIFILSNS